MTPQRPLRFYYAPHTRASAVWALFEELEVQPELLVLNLQAGEPRQPAFKRIPGSPEVMAFVARIAERPARQRAAAREADIAAAQAG